MNTEQFFNRLENLTPIELRKELMIKPLPQEIVEQAIEDPIIINRIDFIIDQKNNEANGRAQKTPKTKFTKKFDAEIDSAKQRIKKKENEARKARVKEEYNEVKSDVYDESKSLIEQFTMAQAPEMQFEVDGRTYYCSREAIVIEDPQGGIKKVAELIAPVGMYRQEESGDHGFLIEFIPVDSRRPQIFEIPAGDTASGRSANKIAAKLLTAGCRITAMESCDFIRAICEWTKEAGLGLRRTRNRNGWCNNTYVNGMSVYGDDNVYPSPNSEELKARDDKKGNIEKWQDLMTESCYTEGLRALIGVSLAGSILRPSRQKGFGVHVFRQTSGGKSVATRLAASVWGSQSNFFHDWNATPNALIAMALRSNDACLILDELSKFNGKDGQLGTLCYDLTEGRERNRALIDGSLRETETWKSTIISNGEVSFDAKTGGLKGGQSVRMVDVRINEGELTTSANHADHIEESIEDVYGVAGDAFVEYVSTLDEKRIRRMVKKAQLAFKEAMDTDSNAEKRIIGQLAPVYVALELARQAGIVTWEKCDNKATMDWLITRVFQTRKEHKSSTPYEQVLNRLYRIQESEPGRFPSAESSQGRVNGKIYGFAHEGGMIVTEGLLNQSGLCKEAGITARAFFDSATEAGFVRDIGRMYVKCLGKNIRGKFIKPEEQVFSRADTDYEKIDNVITPQEFSDQMKKEEKA